MSVFFNVVGVDNITSHLTSSQGLVQINRVWPEIFLHVLIPHYLFQRRVLSLGHCPMSCFIIQDMSGMSVLQKGTGLLFINRLGWSIKRGLTDLLYSICERIRTLRDFYLVGINLSNLAMLAALFITLLAITISYVLMLSWYKSAFPCSISFLLLIFVWLEWQVLLSEEQNWDLDLNSVDSQSSAQ